MAAIIVPNNNYELTDDEWAALGEINWDDGWSDVEEVGEQQLDQWLRVEGGRTYWKLKVLLEEITSVGLPIPGLRSKPCTN